MLALALSLLSVGGCARAVENRDSTTALTGIRVSFKLDPRLTQGMYMGEQWVSPPAYGPLVSSGNTYTVEAKAFRLDAQGQAVPISPEWIPADPDMVTVSPGQGHAVTITVQRAGESRLKVAFQGVSKELTIKAAAYQGDAMQVEISQ